MHLTGYSFILLFQKHTRYRLLVHARPSTWKVEEPRVQNYPLLHSELGTSLGYMRKACVSVLDSAVNISLYWVSQTRLPYCCRAVKGQTLCVLSDSHQVFKRPEQLKVSTPGVTQSGVQTASEFPMFLCPGIAEFLIRPSADLLGFPVFSHHLQTGNFYLFFLAWSLSPFPSCWLYSHWQCTG